MKGIGRTATAKHIKIRGARIVLILPLLLLLASVASPVYSQERTGRIYGRMADASGGVLVGASVSVTNTLTGYTRDIITNDEGLYNATKLPIGNYTVEAEMVGFKRFAQSGIVLTAGDVIEIDVAMQVGEASDTIVVTASPPEINTSSGEVRTSIHQVFVERLPLSGRNANQLILLAPGITGGVKNNYAANGIRETSNNFTLDGIDNQDTYQGRISFSPPPDALQEFTVQTNYSAEYGKGGGMSVIAITKSGTNQLHGSVYDYFRSENLNANSFERNRQGLGKGDFKRHHWGATVGGPVFLPSIYDGRDKTFFFFAVQHLGSPASPYNWRRGGLTAAELAGDFSQSSVIPRITSTAAEIEGSPFAGMAGQTITDLSPFLSPTALKIYQLYNLPVVEESEDFFITTLHRKIDQPDYTLRFDHNLRHDNNLSFSWFHRGDSSGLTQINEAPEGFLSGNTLTSNHFALSDVWSFTPTVVNELIVGYNRLILDEIAEAGNVPYDAFGFPFPKASTHQLVGFKDLGPNRFNLEPENFKGEWIDTYELRDTISFYRGNHFMKAGVLFQVQNGIQLLTQNFEFRYEGDFLRNSVAEFLIGWPTSVDFSGDAYRPGRRNTSHVFFQDDWKVSPRLTLNLGLRWEPMRWGYLKNNNALQFIPGAVSKIFPNMGPGTIRIDEPPSPSRSGRADEWNNFAPRLGMAYRVDDKSVLRAGWGLFYDAIPISHESVDLNSEYPFIHNYGADFDSAYPGPEGWLNFFAYEGDPIPDLSVPPDPLAVDCRRGAGVVQCSRGQFFPPISLGYVHQYNVTYEREVRPGWTASAAYVGSLGRDLWGLDFWNLPLPRDENDSWQRENLASRRPDQEFRFVDKQFVANNGKSNYHAAQFTLKANRNDVHILTHYTYSRAYANIDGVHSSGDAIGYGRSNPFDLDADWGRSVMDIPHRFTFVSSWDLPFLRRRNDLAGKIFGNWALTSWFNIQDGRRVNVVAAENLSYTCERCWVRPDLTGEPLYTPDWKKDPRLTYVNINAFSQPADGTYGSAPRNLLRWPYEKDLDISVLKSFPLFGEVSRFELRLDVFNLFNWVGVNPSQGISLDRGNRDLEVLRRGLKGPRTMQVGMRIVF